MSGGDNTKFVDQTFRRKWNKEEWEAKPENEEDDLLANMRPEAAPRDKRETLEDRLEKGVSVTDRLGEKRLLTGGEDDERSARYGFWCQYCKRGYNDSNSWIEHQNSAQHQRLAGSGVLRRRSNLDDVKDRLKMLKRKHEEVEDEEIDQEERLKKLEMDDNEQKALKKRLKKEAKQRKKKLQEQNETQPFFEDEELVVDDDQAAMMAAMGIPMGPKSKKK